MMFFFQHKSFFDIDVIREFYLIFSKSMFIFFYKRIHVSWRFKFFDYFWIMKTHVYVETLSNAQKNEFVDNVVNQIVVDFISKIYRRKKNDFVKIDIFDWKWIWFEKINRHHEFHWVFFWKSRIVDDFC